MMTPPWSLVCLAVTLTAVSSQFLADGGENEKRNEFSRDIMHFGKRAAPRVARFDSSNPGFEREMMSFGKRVPSGFERDMMSFGKRAPWFGWGGRDYFRRQWRYPSVRTQTFEREFLPFGKREFNDFNRDMMSFGKREDFDRNFMSFGRRRR
ncbi:unnamed protein product [Cylicocyclus nassatus]|uniref:Uncharacterized protein n=1 Tax=Cylicocyclus nassatus TaxID=53992 RepID=A0AA36GIJ1_CYLNA|nr:unnamed protein product [Cylicocyclus nassatus]